ncbi:MAG: TonB-dependent receptor domain-containing protein [Erythrobacter sp.]
MINLRARARREALLLGAGVAALVIANPAMAQGMQDEDPVDVTSSSADSPSPDRAITVTGSRIRNPNLQPFEPTTSIDREFIDQRNFINVADALNTLPQIRGSVTPNGDQAAFGQGVNFINNFGLGSNRTLTLINGRRVVTSNPPSLFGPAAAGTQVDVNIIPTALVKSVDIASTAGAPVYGSDAIAGTVNFILDDRYEGLSLNATSGIYEEGDGHFYRFEGVYGTKFAGGRGHLQLSAFYTYTDGILQSARQDFLNEMSVQNNLTEVGRIAPGIGLDTGPNDGIPATVVFRGLSLFPLSNTGVIFGGPLGVTTATTRPTGAVGNQAFQFDANGNLVPYTVGTRIRALIGGVPTPSGNNAIFGDGFKFSDFGQLTSDLRRFGANLFANYDLTDKINIFVEAQYFDSRADELVQQPTFNTPLFGGASGALTFNINNPFLNDQARGVLQAAGVTNFTLSRANVGFADLTGFAETEFMRGVIGARGDFKIGEKDWHWEAAFNYGKSNITDFRQDINVQNFVNATNVARNAQGQIVCAANLPGGFTGTPVQAGFNPIPDSACVPFNFFGNQASAAALDYVTSDNVTQTNLEQIVFNANVGGTLFKFNNNDISVNGGYEFRREKGSFQPSEFERLGRGRGAAVTPIAGEFTLNEVFGEILMPLITPDNDMLIDSAIIYGRGRYVDNTVNGGFFSWAAGGSIAPIRDIEFRGNFTRSFRAPALAELFLPQANAFGFVPDLCMPGTITGGANPAARQRNCTAFLNAFPNVQRPQQASVASVPIIVGGNPNLLNEQADSYSLGGILRPRFLRNFSLTVDYINIRISNPIAQLNTAQINTACFDNDNFNTADPANGNQFCSLIRRTATGEVVADPGNPGVRTGFTNGNQIDYEGIQGAMLYATSLEGIGIKGMLQMRGDLTVVLKRQIDITGVAPARSDAVIGDPTWAGQFTLNYTNKNWGIGSVWRYTGEQLFSRFDRTPDARQFDKLNDFITTDVNIFYRTDDNFRLNLAVRNLFDRRCQEISGFCIPASRNDTFGRQFTVNVTKEF